MTELFKPSGASGQKKKHKVTFYVTCHPQEVDKMNRDVQTILSNLTPEELNILARVAQKTLVKKMALKEAAKYV